MAGLDDNTKATLQKIPLLTVRAGPRDGDQWIARLKEEYQSLIIVSTAMLATPFRRSVLVVAVPKDVQGERD